MNSAMQRIRVSDLAPTTLRLDPVLLDQLKREAAMNRRSLSAEAEVRLANSFAAPGKVGQAYARASEPLPEHQRQSELNEHQRLLLSLFAALSPEKQLSWLNLMKR
jgi:hypothetical protein